MARSDGYGNLKFHSYGLQGGVIFSGVGTDFYTRMMVDFFFFKRNLLCKPGKGIFYGSIYMKVE